MKTFKVTFYARPKGSTGITKQYIGTIQAANKADVLGELQERYDTVTDLEFKK